MHASLKRWVLKCIVRRICGRDNEWYVFMIYILYCTRRWLPSSAKILTLISLSLM
jgi:hypothetical protein